MALRQKLVSEQLFTLFHLGPVGDLSDRQLLERFAIGDGGGDGKRAELAFTALVERHGPMVLRVCAALLRNPHDAHDAFQATFLVLLRKSRDLWVHDSLGPWLHRVAKRVAARAQATARRRRDFERRAAESRTAFFEPPQLDEPSSVLHEEIDRLPERFRVLVVLCHLEGQSQELAAKTLSLPVGTVKSRLHRARGLLRGRLSQRGVGFSAALLGAETAARAAHPGHPLPLYESMVRTAVRAGTVRAGTSGLISTRATQLFEETIKAMFLTKLRISVVLTLLAGCLAAGAAGVFAQQGPGHDAPKAASGRGKTAGGSPAAPAADPASAPAYVRRSRTMIIERLERELERADGRLDLTVANVRSPNDPEVVRARKTVEALEGLLARVDAVLVEAVDDFPTIFDFTNAQTGPAAGADRATNAADADKMTEYVVRGPTYDEHSLPQAAQRMERSRDLYAKGFVSKAQLESDVRAFELLKTRIDADIAQAAEQAEWARQMFEKGYLTKRQYDLAILKHYDALKARMLGVRSSRTGESQAVTDELLKDYEAFKELLWYAQHQQDPAAESAPGAKPPAKPVDSPAGLNKEGADLDENTHAYIKRYTELTPPAKTASETAPRTPPAKPEDNPRRP